MIGHAIYCQHFLSFLLNDAGNILVKLFFPCWFDKALPASYSKNDLNIYLGVGSHCYQSLPPLGS